MVLTRVDERCLSNLHVAVVTSIIMPSVWSVVFCCSRRLRVCVCDSTRCLPAVRLVLCSIILLLASIHTIICGAYN